MTKCISEDPSVGLVADWEALGTWFLETWSVVRPFYVRWKLINLLSEFLADDEVDIAELVERIIDITGGVECKT